MKNAGVVPSSTKALRARRSHARAPVVAPSASEASTSTRYAISAYGSAATRRRARSGSGSARKSRASTPSWSEARRSRSATVSSSKAPRRYGPPYHRSAVASSPVATADSNDSTSSSTAIASSMAIVSRVDCSGSRSNASRSTERSAHNTVDRLARALRIGFGPPAGSQLVARKWPTRSSEGDQERPRDERKLGLDRPPWSGQCKLTERRYAKRFEHASISATRRRGTWQSELLGERAPVRDPFVSVRNPWKSTARTR